MFESITLILLSLLIIFLISSCVISIFEREYFAANRLLLMSAILSLLVISFFIFDFSIKYEVFFAIDVALILTAVILFLPLKGKQHKPSANPSERIDERTIMFSRNELVPGTETHDKYYELYPEHKESDDSFRQKPGLLNKNAALYDPFMFNSSKASFETVQELAGFIDGNVADEKLEVDKQSVTNYINDWAKSLGAHSVGFTLVKDYHIYKTAGRKKNYGQNVMLKHKFAIAFTTEMDFNMVKSAPNAPIVMESAKQYLNAGVIACQIAAFIRNLGYPARAHIDGNYQVICPLVAKDAGLGEIGRMGLLMTPRLGPRVRIAVVTTDLELVTNDATSENSVIDFCTNCKKCADVCPSNAISFKSREKINDTLRWQINQEACFNYWCVSGTDCGRCMSVCPYSHPNNAMHNIVRIGIKNSSVFRNFALKMDDVLYGRKPLPAKPLKWMKVKSEK